MGYTMYSPSKIIRFMKQIWGLCFCQKSETISYDINHESLSRFHVFVYEERSRDKQ